MQITPRQLIETNIPGLKLSSSSITFLSDAIKLHSTDPSNISPDTFFFRPTPSSAAKLPPIAVVRMPNFKVNSLSRPEKYYLPRVDERF
jgi:hypothetical protein